MNPASTTDTLTQLTLLKTLPSSYISVICFILTAFDIVKLYNAVYEQGNNTMTKNYLLCYDICNEKRLYRVRKISYPFALGGQKSALELPLTQKEAKAFLAMLEQKIAPEDKINLIEVEEQPRYLGKSIQLHFEEGMIII